MRILFDENLAAFYQAQMKIRVPDAVFRRVGDSDAPPLGTQDPQLLEWCLNNDIVLVSNDRNTLPDHFADCLVRRNGAPGLLLFRPAATVRDILDDLELIATASTIEEYKNRLLFIPFSQTKTYD